MDVSALQKIKVTKACKPVTLNVNDGLHHDLNARAIEDFEEPSFPCQESRPMTIKTNEVIRKSKDKVVPNVFPTSNPSHTYFTSKTSKIQKKGEGV